MAVMTASRRQRRVVGQALLYVLLILASLVVLLPYLWMISSSLKPSGEIFTPVPHLIPRNPRWQNYADVLRNYQVGQWLVNSMIVSSLETAGVVSTSILAGYAFGRLRFWGRDTVFFMYLGAMMIPIQVTVIPSFLIVRWLGWIDSYEGLVIPKLCAFFGVFLMRQFFLNFPAELEEAAFIDGSSRWRALWQIVLPLSTPALAALAIFSFTSAWNDFLWPLVVINSEEIEDGSAWPVVDEGRAERLEPDHGRRDPVGHAAHGAVPPAPAVLRAWRGDDRAQGVMQR